MHVLGARLGARADALCNTLRPAAIPMLLRCSITSFRDFQTPSSRDAEFVALIFTATFLSGEIGSYGPHRMSLEEITLSAFAACNSLRIFAYVPQLLKAASDENGASAISYTTWSLFLLAHLSTVAYAIVNQSDWWLAACFGLNAACCLAIVVVAYGKRRRYLSRSGTTRPPLKVRFEGNDRWRRSASPASPAFFHWD
jgi:hypothetical protein